MRRFERVSGGLARFDDDVPSEEELHPVPCTIHPVASEEELRLEPRLLLPSLPS